MRAKLVSVISSPPVAGKGGESARRPDLGERRRDADRQRRTGRNRGLNDLVAERRAVDEVGVGEDGRARENDRGDLALVVGKRHHDGTRRLRRAGKNHCDRLPDQRRGIVEHGREGVLGFPAILG